MSNTEAKHPINPVSSKHYSDFRGLTKREYFAAMAMQGLLAEGHDSKFIAVIAKKSCAMADFLIEELNKKEEKPIQ